MRYLTIISVFGLLLSLPLHAAASGGLYEAEVEVSDQAPSTRAAGMQKAMVAVLLKVSGTNRVTENKALIKETKNPSRYVQQYRYRSAAGGDSDKGRLILQVSFDPKSIDSLLRSHDFGVWGKTRPSTLVWLGVEDKGSRVIVGANDGGLLRKLLISEGERRALSLKLPLLDMTDQSRVTTSDIWGEFFDTIRKASQRYEAQAILVGRLYPLSSSRWEVRWALDYHGAVQRWQEQDNDVSSLIARAVARVSDHLSKNFAESVTSRSGDLLIRVDDVRSLGDYRRVLDYLKGVQGIKHVVSEGQKSGSMYIRLSTEGGSEAALRVIALGNTLERVVETQMRYSYGRPGSAMQTSPQRELPPGAASQQGTAGQPGAVTGTASVAPPVTPDMVYRLLP